MDNVLERLQLTRLSIKIFQKPSVFLFCVGRFNMIQMNFSPDQNIFMRIGNVKGGEKKRSKYFANMTFSQSVAAGEALTPCKYPVGSSLESFLFAQTDVH